MFYFINVHVGKFANISTEHGFKLVLLLRALHTISYWF